LAVLQDDCQPDLLRLAAAPAARGAWVDRPPETYTVASEAGGRRACLLAPMVYQDRLIGLLLVTKAAAEGYSAKDAQTVTTIAAQAAMTIENARLYQESQRRALQLQAVSEVSQKATAILDLDELLAQVVELIRSTFGYSCVALFLVEKGSGEIVLREASTWAGVPLKERPVRLRLGQGLTGWAAQTRRLLLVNDVHSDPRYQPHDLLPETAAEIAVPLTIGETILGVLDVQSEVRDAFDEDDAIALQVLADQVAIAIENARLFRSARHQFQAMRALHEISLEITAQLDSDRVVPAILEHAARLADARASVLGVYDPQTDLVRVIAAHNIPLETVVVSLNPGEGAGGRVVATGEPLIVNDYRRWEGRMRVFDSIDLPVNAQVSLPLRWQGAVFGVLSVMDRVERRPFSAEDVQLLGPFADLASIALKKAELYAEVTRLSQDLERRVARRTLELNSAKEELAHKAAQLQELLALTLHIQEEERSRIALDLHDGSNQLIAGALYEMQAAQQSLADQRYAVSLKKIQAAKDLLRRIEAENRRIIAGLRPPLLDAQGLVPTLDRHLQQFQKRRRLAGSLQVFGRPARLPPNVETAVFRIVQESLNNVAAHAQARNVQVVLDFRQGGLRVVVQDDGTGFEPGGAAALSRGRMGMLGMRERAQSIGGRVEVHSGGGQGTRVVLDVPSAQTGTQAAKA
jgi:signal transduction histidine kinase